MQPYKQAFILQKALDKKLAQVLKMENNEKKQSILVNDVIKIVSRLPDTKSTACQAVANSIMKAYKNQGVLRNDFNTGSQYDKALVDFYNTLVRQLPRSAIDNLNTLNKQIIDMTSKGKLTQDQAVKVLLNSSGYRGFVLTDASGRKRTLASSMKMAVRQQMKSATRLVSEDIASELGTDIYEVSSHPDARPKCEEDQGKLYSDTGGTFTDIHGVEHEVLPWSDSSEGEDDGLFGYNCRHIKYPMVAGFNVPNIDPLKKASDVVSDTEVQVDHK